MDSAIIAFADNDEETAVFFWILNSKDRTYYKLKKSDKLFKLDELEESFCVTHFRFYKRDIRRLLALFCIPDEIVLNNRIKMSGEEALCILLRRLAYPNRLVDLMQHFPRGISALSVICNAMVEHILATKGHLLEDLNQQWLSRDNIKMFCERITQKGSPYTRCFGFLDGTVRPKCRPVYHQRQFYSGHKKLHGIKFQSVILPNGIIANLFGPINARRHDSFLRRKSGLLNKLDQKFNIFRTPPYLYADSAYPLKKYLMKPFKGILNNRQKIVQKKMKKLRVSVEWGFAKIIQLFPFVDFKKNQKIYKQNEGNYYKVATILTNCHTTLYGSEISDYFQCDPPKLEQYL